LNKFESSCPKDAPYQISMHSGQWFIRRRVLNIYQNFPYSALLFEQSESPSPKHVSYKLWLKLAKWFLRRRRLKEKS